MASAYSQAKGIYKAIRGNPAAIKVQRDAFAAAATALTSTTGGIQIESATVNGQSFAGKATSTPADRFEILRILMTMLDNESAGTRTVIGRFQ